MTVEQQTYRKQLLDLGREVNEEIETMADDVFRSAGSDASGTLASAPTHLADLATDYFQQQVSISLLEREDKTREEIAAALERLEAGTFGRCEECEQRIAPERLEVMPYARYCVRCAAALGG